MRNHWKFMRTIAAKPDKGKVTARQQQVVKVAIRPVYPSGELLHLQHEYGNRFVQRMLELPTHNGRSKGIRKDPSVSTHSAESPLTSDIALQRQSDTAKGESKATSTVTITFGPDANQAVVSAFSRQVLEDILKAAGLNSAVITSTARTPGDQARAMYNNLEAYGVAHQKALYGSAGDKVIDVYVELKKQKKTADEIKSGMQTKIEELGPANVSNHCADPEKKNVLDVSPASVVDKKAFEKAVVAEGRVSKFIKPPADPAYHLEIPQ